MAAGPKFAAISAGRILGASDFSERFLDYLMGEVQTTNKRAYHGRFFHPDEMDFDDVGVSDRFKVEPGNPTKGSFGSDGEGHFLDSTTCSWCLDVWFENTVGVYYYVGLHHCVIPRGIQVNPDSGLPEYVSWEDQIGHSTSPSGPGAVVNNMDGTITFSVDGSLEVGVDNSGRKVIVYKNVLARGAITEAIAVEECTVSYSAPFNTITTVAALGQEVSEISTIGTDYTVVGMGPTVRRYQDLRTADGYAFIGMVEGGGRGNNPVGYDVADQKIVIQFWSDVALDGLRGAFLPFVDNVYNIGSPSLRWANFYVTNLVSGGHLLPGVDNTYDLGSGSFQWRNLYVGTNVYTQGISTASGPGTGILSDLIPAADSTYDLGSASYAFAEVRVDDMYCDTLDTTWVGASLHPDTDDTYDLGNSSYEWQSIYIDGYVYADKLLLDDTAGEGVAGHLVPVVDSTHSLGNTLYHWLDVYCDVLRADGSIDFLPLTDDTYDLGSGTFQWQDLYIDGTAYVDTLSLSEVAGEGVTTRFVPAADDTYDLGNGTYDWKNIYITDTAFVYNLWVSAAGGDGVTSDLVPDIDSSLDLGNASYRWAEVYFDDVHTLEMAISTTAGEGFYSSIVPTADDSYDLGAALYQWKDLWLDGVAHIDTLSLSSDAGEGVSSMLVPTIDNTSQLGFGAKRWSEVNGVAGIFTTIATGVSAGEGLASNMHSDGIGTRSIGSVSYYYAQMATSLLYYKTQATFDDFDDLALIDGYESKDEWMTVDKGGEKRQIRLGNQNTLPWPMLGPKDPTIGDHFLDLGDSTVFLLGAIKQLYRKHKDEVGRLNEIIAHLADDISKLQRV